MQTLTRCALRSGPPAPPPEGSYTRLPDQQQSYVGASFLLTKLSIFFKSLESITSNFFKWALKVLWALTSSSLLQPVSQAPTYPPFTGVPGDVSSPYSALRYLCPIPIPLSAYLKPLPSVWSCSIALPREVALNCPSGKSDLLILSSSLSCLPCDINLHAPTIWLN